MTDFLGAAHDALTTRLEGEDFQKSVSLRIKDIGNLFISGDKVEISNAQADCAIFASEDTLSQILEGTLKPMKAVMFGQLTVKGDAASAMKFGNLFT